MQVFSLFAVTLIGRKDKARTACLFCTYLIPVENHAGIIVIVMMMMAMGEAEREKKLSFSICCCCSFVFNLHDEQTRTIFSLAREILRFIRVRGM